MGDHFELEDEDGNLLIQIPLAKGLYLAPGTVEKGTYQYPDTSLAFRFFKVQFGPWGRQEMREIRIYHPGSCVADNVENISPKIRVLIASAEGRDDEGKSPVHPPFGQDFKAYLYINP